MRKVRRDDDWNGLFHSFDDEFDVMRERMDRLMEAALRGTGSDPLVYGVSMRTGSDGKPVVREMRKGLPFYYLPDMDFGARDAVHICQTE